VDDVRSPGIPLQLANESRFAHRTGQVDQPAAVPQSGVQLFGADRQGDRFQAVAIQDGGDVSRLAKPTALVFSPRGPGDDVELFRHGYPRNPIDLNTLVCASCGDYSATALAAAADDDLPRPGANLAILAVSPRISSPGGKNFAIT
jgi:hypothetical protein